MVSVLSFLESKVITKWLQREWLRAKIATKWRQGCQASVFSQFVGPGKESVLFSKCNLSAAYNYIIRTPQLEGEKHLWRVSSGQQQWSRLALPSRTSQARIAEPSLCTLPGSFRACAPGDRKYHLSLPLGRVLALWVPPLSKEGFDPSLWFTQLGLVLSSPLWKYRAKVKSHFLITALLMLEGQFGDLLRKLLFLEDHTKFFHLLGEPAWGEAVSGPLTSVNFSTEMETQSPMTNKS
jgi:hypothetical protein